MITFLQGDATSPKMSDSTGLRYITHVCNNRGGWGRGFVLALSKKYPLAERKYREEWRTSPLGTNIYVSIPDKRIVVVNMIAQDGYVSSYQKRALCYDSLHLCLTSLSEKIKGSEVHRGSVHMPRIGCGLAGGEWRRVERVIRETILDIPVFVYDLPRRQTGISG